MYKVFGLLAATIATFSAWGAQPIAEKRPLDSDGVVVIENPSGEVYVSGWDRNEVELSGELGSDNDAPVFSGNSRRLRIIVDPPGRSHRAEAANLRIRIPHAASIKIETTSADIQVEAIDGESLEIETVSGDTKVNAESARVEIKAISGDIDLVTTAQRTTLSTVSGGIDAQGMSGELRATTVSGELRVGGRRFERVRAETVSGNMEFDLDLRDEADVMLSSLSGRVALLLQDKVSAFVSAESFSGRIQSDRGEVQKSRYGPHKTLQFTLGDGIGRIRLESHSGDLRIRTR